MVHRMNCDIFDFCFLHHSSTSLSLQRLGSRLSTYHVVVMSEPNKAVQDEELEALRAIFEVRDGL
jgi:hypothetical protein